MNKNELVLLEAIDTMLQHDAQLGLKIHADKNKKSGEAERGYEYLHNQIDEMFALKAAELLHADGICRAFTKIHNYKYLDDPTFKTAMEKEMIAQAVPSEERAKAIEFVPSIINELKQDQAKWAEKDFGFNPKLDEIKEVSQIEQPLDFEIEDVDDWMGTESEFEDGDASPGRTPSDD